MTNDLEVQVTPMVRVSLFGEEDFLIAFTELNATVENQHDPATISDNELIELVANFMDITPVALQERVYGDGNSGDLKVSRSSTGNINIRVATTLG